MAWSARTWKIATVSTGYGPVTIVGQGQMSIASLPRS
jgi:hypothetical protein